MYVCDGFRCTIFLRTHTYTNLPSPHPNTLTHTHTHTLGVLFPAAPTVTDSVREDGRVHHVARCSRGCVEDPRLVCCVCVCVCVCVSLSCGFGCGVGVYLRVCVNGVRLERACASDRYTIQSRKTCGYVCKYVSLDICADGGPTLRIGGPLCRGSAV
jgi:hypothetical protein